MMLQIQHTDNPKELAENMDNIMSDDDPMDTHLDTLQFDKLKSMLSSGQSFHIK